MNRSEVAGTGWGAYWRRDLGRNAIGAHSEPQTLWSMGCYALPARTWVGVAVGATGLIGALLAVEMLLSAGFSPGTVGVAVVLAWGPWMLGCLAVIHLLRLACQLSRSSESESAFLTQVRTDCGSGVDSAIGSAVDRAVDRGVDFEVATRSAGRVDRGLALATRRALAEVYGVSAERVRAGDCGWGLSWWMEQPHREEFCEVFLREWGCGMSPEILAERLGPIPAGMTVSGLAGRLSEAVGGRK